MGKYGQPSKDIRLTLPSAPECHIWGPDEIDYWDEIQIRSRSSRTEINPMTGQGLTIVDSALFEYEMLHRWLEQADTHWDLYDENNMPYDMTTQTIDRLFKGRDGRRDRDHIVVEVGRVLFPEMQFGVSPGAPPPPEDAEGNGSGPPSDPGAPVQETVGQSSNEPSPQSPLPTNTETWDGETGFTTSPTEAPSPATS